MPKKIILKLSAGIDALIERYPLEVIVIMAILMVVEIIYFIIRDYNLMRIIRLDFYVVLA